MDANAGLSCAGSGGDMNSANPRASFMPLFRDAIRAALAAGQRARCGGRAVQRGAVNGLPRGLWNAGLRRSVYWFSIAA